ncbi:MAG: winged helix-turn-helix domain-containing protein [Planctomycetota bacterium]
MGAREPSLAPSLEALVGGTAAKLLLYLVHYGEAYPTAVAEQFGLSLAGVQHQCRKLEEAGLLISKKVGRTRVYRFQPKHPAVAKLRALAEVFYEGIPLEERAVVFATRRRPRRAGKPVDPVDVDGES